MKSKYLWLILIISISLINCGGSLSLTPSEMLEFSGRNNLPTKSEYPDYGAVVLYENKYVKLYLDSEWDVNIKETYHNATLYFDERAENILTRKIYLDPDISLVNFSARTIKPNGDIIELSEEDLFPANTNSGLKKFSKENSVKFTFQGVVPNSIVEYSYTVNKQRSFLNGDIWAIQTYIPKLYSKYSLELPKIFFQYHYNWNFAQRNIEVGNPKVYNNLVTESSIIDASKIFYWEVKNIKAIEPEPDQPPYRKIAKHVRVALKYDNWKKLSHLYWEKIKDRFQISDKEYFDNLVQKIIGNSKTEEEIIRKIFNYVQENFRYIAVNVGESGYVPNFPETIEKNKYGDCKDMTVMNVVLLRSQGIKAYPALINTSDRGDILKTLISLDFNHMITYVIDKNGKEYWLDATGNSCPLGEVSSSIEGMTALVIDRTGKSFFKKVPNSNSSDNKLVRNIQIQLKNDNQIKGSATLVFYGNYNLSIRSLLKNESSTKINSVIEKYVKANSPNLEISNIECDDLTNIVDTFKISFDFYKDHLGALSKNLLIFKPHIFTLKSELSKYSKAKRVYEIELNEPFRVIDKVQLIFDPEKYSIESLGNNIFENNKVGRFYLKNKEVADNKISFFREYVINKKIIPVSKYEDFKKIHKAIARGNEETIMLKIQQVNFISTDGEVHSPTLK